METAQLKPLNLTPKNSIRIQSSPNRRLYIQCQQWGSGQKFLSIFKSKPKLSKYWLNILVPQDAYKFVAAMDEVIRQLPAEEPTHPEGDESPLVLATQTVESAPHYDGRHYEYKLSAWHQKGDQWNFDIQIQSLQTSEEYKDTKYTLYFPFSALSWLREQMVEMLAEHDGSQRIDEIPRIPEWAIQDSDEQQPDEEQVTEKKADEHCPCCTKESKCWRHER